MVVHNSISGNRYAFCLTCKDMDMNLIQDYHPSQYETLSLDASSTRTSTPPLSYSSDMYESESEDLFFDASPKPITNEDQDIYQDYNACAIRGVVGAIIGSQHQASTANLVGPLQEM
ncbi:hypothetical protein LTR56_027510 [Elasticomyces elasticus]|nr:hypothetical protein LTR22_028016 [Elasticomyces elasticus]KAK3614051.1 hypothetical protein LTR56_027510 [Elasticomyces elasticus]